MISSNKFTTGTVVIIALLFFCVAVAQSQEMPGTTAPVYQVSVDRDIIGSLKAKAEFLGLDFAETSEEEGRLGWTAYGTEDYEIRQHDVSGYFTYISKKTDWSLGERIAFSADTENLKSEAVTLLSGLGVDADQIYNVTIHAIVTETEDEMGNPVGERITDGYLVYVLRQIEGIPVVGSTAEVVFDAAGNLHKINVNWREVEKDAIGRRTVVNTETLASEAEAFFDEIIAAKPTMELTESKAMYAYREDPYQEEQSAFELQYVVTYRFGEGPFQRIAFSATE